MRRQVVSELDIAHGKPGNGAHWKLSENRQVEIARGPIGVGGWRANASARGKGRVVGVSQGSQRTPVAFQEMGETRSRSELREDADNHRRSAGRLDALFEKVMSG